jgi:hypothetical protein
MSKKWIRLHVGWVLTTAFLGGILLGCLAMGWPALAQKSASPQKPVPPMDPQKILTAQEIRLVDASGKSRAKITPAPEEGVHLALYHRDGKHMTLYRLNPTGLPSMSFMPVQ